MVINQTLNKVMLKSIAKTICGVRLHMTGEFYVRTCNQSHPTAVERTTPSYLALPPSWILPIIPCVSAI